MHAHRETRHIAFNSQLLQAVGASVRIFELLDRVSEIRDGTLVFEPFKGGRDDLVHFSSTSHSPVSLRS